MMLAGGLATGALGIAALGQRDTAPAPPPAAHAAPAVSLAAESPPEVVEAPNPDADPHPELGTMTIAAWRASCVAPPCTDPSARLPGHVSIRDGLGELARPSLPEDGQELELELPPGEYEIALLDPKTHQERVRRTIQLPGNQKTRADLRVED